jgi:autotransporter-associated beta strand protein
MFFRTLWPRRTRRIASSAPSGRQKRSKSTWIPQLEHLEDRVVPVIGQSTWTGLGTNNLWTTPQNWAGNVAPSPGNDLVFPGGAKQLSNFNNFVALTPFRSITFSGGAYKLTGSPIDLGVTNQGGSVTDSSGAVTNNVALSLFFAGTQGTETISVSSNTVLTFSGQISLSMTDQTNPAFVMKKTGPGVANMADDGSGYVGTVQVSGGALQLQKSSAVGLQTAVTVSTGAAVWVKDVLSTIADSFTLTGTGVSNGGALENIHGSNTITGAITLGGSSVIGADAGSVALKGIVSGGSTSSVLIGGSAAEKSGQVILTNANTYTGPTFVNFGVLNLQNTQALGPTSKTFGVTVNSGAGLELQLNSGTIANQKLTLNRTGVSLAGALHNISGRNIWDGNIVLQTATVSIGADAGSTLTIGDPQSQAGRGIISESGGSRALNKVGNGQLVLFHANTYSGLTTVAQGILTAENNFALGGGGKLPSVGTKVSGQGTLQLALDPISGNSLTMTQPLQLNGLGVNLQGALYSLSGLNTWQGTISLASSAAAGAAPGSTLFLGDPVSGAGTIQGVGGLTKTGGGMVVLPNPDSYLGPTTINAGILEIQDSQSLGTVPAGFAPQSQAPTTVASGAALWVAGVRARDGQTGITVTTPLNLSGIGSNATGAIYNISGTDQLSGNIVLSGDTYVGVAFNSSSPAGSQLTLSGTISESGNGRALRKVGAGTLIVSGNNLYSGITEVIQGTLTAAGSYALGTTAKPAQVDSRASLDLQGGIEVLNKTLILTGSGINNTGALFNASDDNRWTGPISITGNVTIGTATNSRLTLLGNISDGNLGYGLTKTGAGELDLGGTDTFGGGTSVQAGLLGVQSSSALGSSSGSVFVQDGAGLELQQGVNISGQKLNLAGEGPTIPIALPGGGEWYSVGPAAISAKNTAIAGGTVSGRITGIATDPHNANVIYVATAGGGVWQTTNGGTTWQPLTDNVPGLTTQNLFMGAIAIAPTNSNVIYAGTGEANFSGDSYYGQGILASFDAGVTWQLEGSDVFNRMAISKIVVSPVDPMTVYVATTNAAVNGLVNDAAIWRSSDGGATWQEILAPKDIITTSGDPTSAVEFTDVAVDPVPDAGGNLHVYAACGNPFGIAENGLYESLQNGDQGTWFQTNLPSGNKEGRIVVTVMHIPKGPAVLYASIATAIDPKTGNSGLQEIDVGTDIGASTGANFTKVSGTVPNYLGTQGWYDTTIVVNPNNSLQVIAGGQSGPGVVESLDGGATWNDISVGGPATALVGPHSDHHALVFDAAGKVLDGNDGGIWRLASSAVTSIQWIGLNSNLQITQFQSVAINPQNPNIAYGGSQDNGTDKFSGAQTSGALAWSLLQVGGDGGTTAVDPDNPSVVYATFPYPLGSASFFQRSNDAGKTFQVKTKGIGTTDNASFYVPFVVDPSSPAAGATLHRLVLGTDRVYESLNGGDSWTALSAPNTNGWNSSLPITTVAVAPSDRNVIYAATGGGQIFVTVTHGAASSTGAPGWNEVDIPGVASIAQIVVDPQNSMIAYAVRNTFADSGPTGHVFRTFNGGQSWTDISGDLPNLPTWSILVDNRPGVQAIYVGTDTGVYDTTDISGGSHWQQFGDNLPSAQVRQILLDPARNYLAVGTHGRGMFEIALEPAEPNPGALRAIAGNSTWGGNITLAGSSSVVNTVVSADFGASLTLTGTIRSVAPSIGITKNGPGEVVLTSPNTFGGTPTINQGTLVVEDPGALGLGSNVLVNSGGALELLGDSMTFTQHLTINGAGAPLALDAGQQAALVNVEGNNTWAGPITLGSDASLGADRFTQLTIMGVIDDGGQGFGMTKTDGGEVVFANANTYSGNTTVNAGDLNVQNTSALGTGAGIVFVNSGGGLWLQFPVPTVNSPVPVGMKIAPDNVMTSQTLHLSGAGPLGLGALRSLGGNNAWPGAIVLDQPATIGVDDDTSGLTADGGSPLTLSGVISDGSGGPALLTKVGAGMLVLSNDNSFSGGSEVTQGALNIQSPKALGVAQPPFMTEVDDGAVLELLFSDQNGQPTTLFNVPLLLAGSGINGGGAFRNVAGDNIWTGPITLEDAAAIGVEDDLVTGLALNLTIQGAINDNNSSADLSKVGPGTLLFADPVDDNTYGGQTQVASGTLVLSAAGAIASTAGVTVGDGATLQVTGGITIQREDIVLTLGGSGVDGTGALVNLAGSNTLDIPINLNGDTTIGVAQAGDTLTLVSSVGEALGGSGLLKDGPGRLVLAAGTTTTYSGQTTVEDGTLQVDGTLSTGVAVQGGRLGGNGTILGDVSVAAGATFGGGDLAGGTGTLTVGTPDVPASVTMDPGATFAASFSGPDGASSVLINGNMIITGTTLAAMMEPSFSSKPGDQFTLIETTGSLIGTFANITNDIVMVGGVKFHVSYTGNSVVLTRM